MVIFVSFIGTNAPPPLRISNLLSKAYTTGIKYECRVLDAEPV
jgi:hypothetical protein